MNVRRIVASALWAVIGFSQIATASAQNSPYMTDLPKLYPPTFALWQQSLPDSLGPLPEWLVSFKGVVSPIRDVSLGGVSMKFGTACKPHDCGDNIVGVLFAPQRNRIVAVMRLAGKNRASSTMAVGPITSAEFACIQRLIDDHDSRIC